MKNDNYTSTYSPSYDYYYRLFVHGNPKPCTLHPEPLTLNSIHAPGGQRKPVSMVCPLLQSSLQVLSKKCLGFMVSGPTPKTLFKFFRPHITRSSWNSQCLSPSPTAMHEPFRLCGFIVFSWGWQKESQASSSSPTAQNGPRALHSMVFGPKSLKR